MHYSDHLSCQSVDAWGELSNDLISSLSRLLEVPEENFWRTGWMYLRVHHQMAVICNGQHVLNASVPLRSINHSKILCVSLIVVSAAQKTQFLVKGFNLFVPASRLSCAFEGKYLVQEATQDLSDEDMELQSIKFFCPIPTVIGRGLCHIHSDKVKFVYLSVFIEIKRLCNMHI
ncbi:hypothetical protein SAY87_030765 [Trapa incisa]|uniref:Uncharacterized protein n=1 Tax=Trapa incisa TaxID=236973 RepID=A0AAN7KJF7_9MYRT|nr:hypothetical protein SAY87_030765 [Trapa incisa]